MTAAGSPIPSDWYKAKVRLCLQQLIPNLDANLYMCLLRLLHKDFDRIDIANEEYFVTLYTMLLGTPLTETRQFYTNICGAKGTLQALKDTKQPLSKYQLDDIAQAEALSHAVPSNTLSTAIASFGSICRLEFKSLPDLRNHGEFPDEFTIEDALSKMPGKKLSNILKIDIAEGNEAAISKLTSRLEIYGFVRGVLASPEASTVYILYDSVHSCTFAAFAEYLAKLDSNATTRRVNERPDFFKGLQFSIGLEAMRTRSAPPAEESMEPPMKKSVECSTTLAIVTNISDNFSNLKFLTSEYVRLRSVKNVYVYPNDSRRRTLIMEFHTIEQCTGFLSNFERLSTSASNSAATSNHRHMSAKSLDSLPDNADAIDLQSALGWKDGSTHARTPLIVAVCNVPKGMFTHETFLDSPYVPFKNNIVRAFEQQNEDGTTLTYYLELCSHAAMTRFLKSFSDVVAKEDSPGHGMTAVSYKKPLDESSLTPFDSSLHGLKEKHADECAGTKSDTARTDDAHDEPAQAEAQTIVIYPFQVLISNLPAELHGQAFFTAGFVKYLSTIDMAAEVFDNDDYKLALRFHTINQTTAFLKGFKAKALELNFADIAVQKYTASLEEKFEKVTYLSLPKS